MYYGASVFYGFIINEQYIKDLMADWQPPQNSYQFRYNANDVCEKLKEKLGNIAGIDIGVYGDHDTKNYSIETCCHYVEYSEIKSINLSSPLQNKINNLMEAKDKLELGEVSVGWHLSAMFD